MKKQRIIFILSLSTVLLYACTKANTGNNNSEGGALDCSTVSNKAFMTDINPIIQSSCATTTSCHGSGSANGPGALTSYSAVFNARNTIRSAVSSGSMPQNSTISTSQKNSILCWIDSGAPNN